MTKRVLVALIAFASVVTPAAAHADGQVGTSFPPGFPVLMDHSLHVPLTGFGGAGPMHRTPVIFLHGNNDTVFPTTCNGAYGKFQVFAQYFADRGYRLSELWGLNYEGDQCDLLTDETRRAGEAHTAEANVPDLRAFVHAVMRYTHAKQVDIVAHSLGVTLAREWMRQDNAYKLVRRFVGLDGPEHGIINCGPQATNWYVTIGFTPDSPVCREFGSDHTPFLRRLNARGETPGPTRYEMIANADTSFVFINKQDGVMVPPGSYDRDGNPHDFSRSARLRGAKLVLLTGQGRYDMALQASHTALPNSPDAWRAAYEFLTSR
jgi:pimeloyl-ACP methyl ester carboxylesterase